LIVGAPEPANTNGRIIRRERLGGLLNFYLEPLDLGRRDFGTGRGRSRPQRPTLLSMARGLW